MTFAPRPEVLPCTTQRQTCVPQAGPGQFTGWSRDSQCAKMLQRKLLNINLYPEVQIPSPFNIVNFKESGFFLGWLFALTIPIGCLLIGTLSGIVECLALSNTLW